MFDHFTTLCMGGLSGNKISVFFFYLLESSDKVYKLWSSLNAILENHFIEIDSSIMTNYPIKKKKKNWYYLLTVNRYIFTCGVKWCFLVTSPFERWFSQAKSEKSGEFLILEVLIYTMNSRGDSQILEKCFMLNGTKNCQGRVGCDFFRELKRIWV